MAIWCGREVLLLWGLKQPTKVQVADEPRKQQSLQAPSQMGLPGLITICRHCIAARSWPEQLTVTSAWARAAAKDLVKAQTSCCRTTTDEKAPAARGILLFNNILTQE